MTEQETGLKYKLNKQGNEMQVEKSGRNIGDGREWKNTSNGKTDRLEKAAKTL